MAEKKGAALNYEAAAAAAIPVVKALREGLAGNAIHRLYGILNGTCNYILTRMEQENLSFEACLADAQRLGYAEADPTFDIEGHDTAQKLAILASLAFGTKVDESAIYVEGISSLQPADLAAADELGYRVKLLGVAVRTPTASSSACTPPWCARTSAIAQVMGVTNAVTIDAVGLDPITLIGPGAGGAATASAVLSDLADIACGVCPIPFGRPAGGLVSVKKAPMQRHEGGYYIRLLGARQAGHRGDHRPAPGRPGDFAGIDCAAPPPGAAVRRWQEPVRPRYPRYLCDHRGRRAQGPCGGGPR